MGKNFQVFLTPPSPILMRGPCETVLKTVILWGQGVVWIQIYLLWKQYRVLGKFFLVLKTWSYITNANMV